MYKKILLPLFAIMLLASCSSSKKTSKSLGGGMNFAASTPKSTDDGLSYATAIVITETTETKGVDAEYKWIANHYSNYTISGQSLVFQGGKPYDIIHTKMSDGKNLDLYFDISNYFGKY